MSASEKLILVMCWIASVSLTISVWSLYRKCMKIEEIMNRLITDQVEEKMMQDKLDHRLSRILQLIIEIGHYLHVDVSKWKRF